MDTIIDNNGILRSRLRVGDIFLFNALEKCWDIALNEWLAAIPPDDGSFNSFPHLRNIEKYLNQIVDVHEKTTVNKISVLSSVEIYLLLSSVLFHDIGKWQKSNEHGFESYISIKEHYSSYGIPSMELANSISLICLYHEPTTEKSKNKLIDKLTTTIIDPYGPIREKFIAALLTLADRMDSAYNRIYPPYLNSNQLGGKSLFRRMIRGIYIDSESKTIKTIVNSEEYKDDQHYIYIKNNHQNNKWRQVINARQKKKEGKDKSRVRYKLIDIEKAYSMKEIEKILAAKLTKNLVVRCKKSIEVGKSSLINLKYPLFYRMLSNEFFLIMPSSGKRKKGIIITRQLTLSLIFSNVLKCIIDLERIENNLASGGIYIKSWLVEINEHLFNQRLQETFEPILSKEYLTYVTNGMWNLSTQVFGYSSFTYDELASYISETNIEKVRKAVRRISIIDISNKRQKSLSIFSYPEKWSWKKDASKNGCNIMRLNELLDKIEKLGEPRQYGLIEKTNKG
jgi:hypothetical protein